MCCFLAVLALFGPRLAIIVWWIAQPARWQAAFSSFIWPLLGFLFVPFTTLMYVLVAPGGVMGFDWVWLALALFADLGSYAGGGVTNRDRLPG